MRRTPAGRAADASVDEAIRRTLGGRLRGYRSVAPGRFVPLRPDAFSPRIRAICRMRGLRRSAGVLGFFGTWAVGDDGGRVFGGGGCVVCVRWMENLDWTSLLRPLERWVDLQNDVVYCRSCFSEKIRMNW